MPHATSYRMVDLPVDHPTSGETLRVGVGYAADGTAVELVLALGSGYGLHWRGDRAQALSLPVQVGRPLAEVVVRLIGEAPAVAGDAGLAEAIHQVKNDTPAHSGNIECPHPRRLLIDIRPARHTAGPDTVWIGDCSKCGEPGIPVEPLVGREPQPVAATPPSSPRTTCEPR